MTKSGFALLAMGFTGPKALQFKIGYINAFDAMEAKILRLHKKQVEQLPILANQLMLTESRAVELDNMINNDLQPLKLTVAKLKSRNEDLEQTKGGMKAQADAKYFTEVEKIRDHLSLLLVQGAATTYDLIDSAYTYYTDKHGDNCGMELHLKSIRESVQSMVIRVG